MTNAKLLNPRSFELRVLIFITGAMFALAGAGCKHQTQQVQEPVSTGGVLHPYAGALEPDDGQWVRATKDYANTRYSTLDQINAGNVANLKVAWTFDTGTKNGLEA